MDQRNNIEIFHYHPYKSSNCLPENASDIRDKYKKLAKWAGSGDCPISSPPFLYNHPYCRICEIPTRSPHPTFETYHYSKINRLRSKMPETSGNPNILCVDLNKLKNCQCLSNDEKRKIMYIISYLQYDCEPTKQKLNTIVNNKNSELLGVIVNNCLNKVKKHNSKRNTTKNKTKGNVSTTKQNINTFSVIKASSIVKKVSFLFSPQSNVRLNKTKRRKNTSRKDRTRNKKKNNHYKQCVQNMSDCSVCQINYPKHTTNTRKQRNPKTTITDSQEKILKTLINLDPRAHGDGAVCIQTGLQKQFSGPIDVMLEKKKNISINNIELKYVNPTYVVQYGIDNTVTTRTSASSDERDRLFSSAALEAHLGLIAPPLHDDLKPPKETFDHGISDDYVIGAGHDVPHIATDEILKERMERRITEERVLDDEKRRSLLKETLVRCKATGDRTELTNDVTPLVEKQKEKPCKAILEFVKRIFCLGSNTDSKSSLTSTAKSMPRKKFQKIKFDEHQIREKKNLVGSSTETESQLTNQSSLSSPISKRKRPTNSIKGNVIPTRTTRSQFFNT